MPRSRRLVCSDRPLHVSARAINKNWFKIPINEVWDIFSRHLYFSHHAYGAKIHAFVLMNNHFHLILTAPMGNLDKIMWYLMKEVSQEITRQSMRVNQTFGGPYFSSILGTEHYFLHAYKYIYRNPVEAGISAEVTSYPYSTLHGITGKSHLLIPMEPDILLFENPRGTLDWLNTQYLKEDRESIRIALRKKSFRFPIDRKTRRKCPLEIDRS